MTTENDRAIAELLQRDEIDSLLDKIKEIYEKIGNRTEINVNMCYDRFSSFQAYVRDIIYDEEGNLKLELTEEDYNNIVYFAKDFYQFPYTFISILKSEIEAQCDLEGYGKLNQYYQLEENSKSGIRQALDSIRGVDHAR